MKREIGRIDTGLWIKTKRRALNMSREQLSDIAGCHANTLGRFERGEKAPTVDVFEKICAALGAELVIREKQDARIREDACY